MKITLELLSEIYESKEGIGEITGDYTGGITYKAVSRIKHG
jgi:hypothetical protein